MDKDVLMVIYDKSKQYKKNQLISFVYKLMLTLKSLLDSKKTHLSSSLFSY